MPLLSVGNSHACIRVAANPQELGYRRWDGKCDSTLAASGRGALVALCTAPDEWAFGHLVESCSTAHRATQKLTLVRALAVSLAATFLSVTGAEVYSAYVGEAERAVSRFFGRARAQQPSVVFLDEIDALVGSRGIGGSAEGRGW